MLDDLDQTGGVEAREALVAVGERALEQLDALALHGGHPLELQPSLGVLERDRFRVREVRERPDDDRCREDDRPRAREKRALLRAIIDREGERCTNAIVFCNRKTDVDIVAKSLKKYGHDAAPIHGDLDPFARKAIAEEMRDELMQLSDINKVINFGDRPFEISIEVSEQTLRKYERLGLVQPTRTIGSMRVYSRAEIERLRTIKHLVDELGINLAGVQRLLSVADCVARIRPLVESGTLERLEGRRRLSRELERLSAMLGL